MNYRKDTHLIGAILKHLEPGDTFWDIGANFGLYSMVVQKWLEGKGGRVISFDPDPWCQERLEENRELNSFPRLKIMKVALAKERGRMDLHVAEHSIGGTSALSDAPENGKEGRQVIQVEVLPGDQVREEQNLEVPGAIKIDVEGFEWEVVQGLEKTLKEDECRFVLVEIHSTLLEQRNLPQAVGEIEELLQKCGFQNISWLDYSHLSAAKKLQNVEAGAPTRPA
jgi:FkbM family methyltransferase